MSETLNQIKEHLDSPANCGDLNTLRGTMAFLTDENRDRLDALLGAAVALGMIKKTGQLYHGVGYEPQKSTAKPSTAYVSPKNANGRSTYTFPDDVLTDREKYNYLLSEEAPLLENTYQLFFDDFVKPERGGKIAEALTSHKISHNIIMAPDRTLGRNVERQHVRKTMTVGVGFQFLNGSYRLSLNTHSKSEVFEFDSWDKVKNWILENV